MVFPNYLKIEAKLSQKGKKKSRLQFLTLTLKSTGRKGIRIVD